MSKIDGKSTAFPMSEALRKLCLENPWLSCADKFLQGPNVDGKYIVEKDRTVLEVLKRNHRELYNKFYFDILPDPLVGNVCAPVIVVCLNPGYSALDKYNYESIDAKTKAQVRKEYKDKIDKLNAKRKKGKEEKAPFERDIRFLYSGEEEERQLKRRRELMIQSLKLIPGNLDYALDESFDSAEIINLKTGRRDAAANLRFGTHNWHRFLLGCGKDGTTKISSKNVFCLEYFPYHSENLSTYGVKVLENECPVAHNLFRDRFLELRLSEGAYVIARSQNLRKLLLDKFRGHSAQIGSFSSQQSSALSENNIINGDGDARKDKAFKDKVMSLLKG